MTFQTMRLYLQMVQRMVTQLDQPVLLNLKHKSLLPENTSIYSAEIKAIDLALDHIEQSRNSDFIIVPDSLFVLQSLHNRHIENPLLLVVLLTNNDLADLNHIVFVGFPVMLDLKATKKPTSLQNRP